MCKYLFDLYLYKMQQLVGGLLVIYILTLIFEAFGKQIFVGLLMVALFAGVAKSLVYFFNEWEKKKAEDKAKLQEEQKARRREARQGYLSCV